MVSTLKKFPINMVLFGSPGVGKSVYCGMLEKSLGIKAFSTGEFSRLLLNNKKSYLQYFSEHEMSDIEHRLTKGELLNDDMVNKMVYPKLVEAKTKGIILDGYPRNLDQAKYLFENLHIDILFNVFIKEEYIIRKLLGRRICPCCNKAYNIENIQEGEYDMPPMLPKKKLNKCDKCDVDLIQRKDDNPDIIHRRQEIYNNSVKDILEFYDEKGLLCQFEPKMGVSDFPKMLDAIVNFVNSKTK